MQITLGGFYAAVVLGLSTYFVWYIVPTEASGSPVAQVQGTTVIPMSNFAFVPFEISVPLGTTVEWINQDDAPHTVTYDNGSVDSKVLNKGESFKVTYNQIGDFKYYCAFHGSPGTQGMSGIIHVVSAQQVAAAPTAELPPTATPAPTPAPGPLVSSLPPTTVGFLEFRDNRALNDELLLVASGVAAPTDGSTLAFWLNGPNGPKSLGPLKVDANGNVNHSFIDPLAFGGRLRFVFRLGRASRRFRSGALRQEVTGRIRAAHSAKRRVACPGRFAGLTRWEGVDRAVPL
ncbi:MAG: cupredoxin domain-containing protein [Chloroflexi bacterium]|nr:cupredoxin domain-containing protein [Chloroflexota bacterium]